ncbi:MAG: inorganic phosphate transporter [Breznakibacter sp.]
MEPIFIVFLIILAGLAVLDLMVGVSNDAVNFLNSAIGSKSGSRHVIMAIAATGIFLGASFSSGMMEIARSGVFNPQHFYFNEIIVIFMAVMLTDVILLDVFNSLGLPTSTTVSIVFELLGASVAVAMIKASSNPDFPISEYINSANVLGIISAILLSVVLSFLFGGVIQYITRLIFSFEYKKKIKKYGALWGGIAITGITYFLIIKGAKGAAFMTADMLYWIKHNTLTLLLISFAFWALILQLINSFTKFDILNIVVLMGTFSLAMAFAANDLVNFIGVPIAGYEAVKIMMATPGATPDTLLMGGLNSALETETLLLIIAGAIMVVTLYTSKKARLVTKTELDLSRQNEGDERWGSSMVARSIVRKSIAISSAISRWLPEPVKKFIDKQFDTTAVEERRKHLGTEAPQFDKLRASVNLAVASMLIAAGTSLKLPLSTTYVTFMVAMSTSLADRAWGRESAVYRITGVLSVIGGWFLTALAAFTIAFTIALLVYYGGITAILALLTFALVMIYRTFRRANKKLALIESEKRFEYEEVNGEISGQAILKQCKTEISDILQDINSQYHHAISSFENEDRKSLREITDAVDELNKRTKKLKSNVYPTVKKLQDEFIESSLYYIQVIDYIREMAHCLSFIVRPMYDHLNNNHKVFSKEQWQELESIRKQLHHLISHNIEIIKSNGYDKIEESESMKRQLLSDLQESRKLQLKRIKKENAGTKVSLLYLNILHETQNLTLHLHNLVKANRDMMS